MSVIFLYPEVLKNCTRERERERERERKEGYQSMTPEATESLTNSQRPENASMEKPVHVRGHPPQIV